MKIGQSLERRISKSVSFQFFHVCLSIVNIWKVEIRLSMAQLHYQAPLHILFLLYVCFLVFLSNPCLSCLSSLSGCVSHIVQCSAWEHLIKRWDIWAVSDQKFSRWSHHLSTHIPSPNITYTFYFSTFPVYTCTVLLFVLW